MVGTKPDMQLFACNIFILSKTKTFLFVSQNDAQETSSHFNVQCKHLVSWCRVTELDEFCRSCPECRDWRVGKVVETLHSTNDVYHLKGRYSTMQENILYRQVRASRIGPQPLLIIEYSARDLQGISSLHRAQIH